MQYELARARKNAAYERYCAASSQLELETIRCRLAELRSQHEPAAAIVKKDITDEHTIRSKLIEAAEFVVLGGRDRSWPRH